MLKSRFAPALMAMGLAVALGTSPRAAEALPPGFIDEVIVPQWDQAVGVAFLPDGRGVVWERAGRVYLVENGQRRTPALIDISEEVRLNGDYGLLGLAIDPDFANNGRIYLGYAVDWYYHVNFGLPGYDPDTSWNDRDSFARITRYTCNAADSFRSIVPGSRQVLLGETAGTGVPMVNASHGPGALAFAPDGTLLASFGDAASYDVEDAGGPAPGSSNTALADGIISAREDVGAFRAQLLDCHNGKILRIDPLTGNGVPGNPFYSASAPRAPRSRVWALGLRNPFRFTLKAGTATAGNPVGTIVIGDVGWERREEINVCTAPGQNFGWPLFEGVMAHPEYTAAAPMNLDTPNPLFGVNGCTRQYFKFSELLVQDSLASPSWANPCNAAVQIAASTPTFEHTLPIIEWGHGNDTRVPIFVGNDASSIEIESPDSPVHGEPFSGACSLGGVWYTGSNFPAEYIGTYFHGDFAGEWIKAFHFETDGSLHEVHEFQDHAGAIVGMAQHPDGTIWYISYGTAGLADLRQIRFDTNLPPSLVAEASVTFGASPLSVQFSTAGTSEPEQEPLTFLWHFGDGTPDSTQANPTHVYTAPTSAPIAFTTTVFVSDASGHTVSKSFLISPNNSPPSVQITSPLDGTRRILTGPEDVLLRSIVSDGQTPANELSCMWQKRLHHNTHTHPDLPTPGCETEETVEPHGGANSVFFYEFVLTVTDPQGLSTEASTTILPYPCGADVDDGTGTGTPDLGVDINDLLYFLVCFENGAICGDLDDDGEDPQNRDMGVDINDLIFFLVHFEQGC